MSSFVAASGTSVAAETSEAKTIEQVNPGTVFHCNNNKKLLVDLYNVPTPHRHRSVEVVYECDSGQHLIALTDDAGHSINLDRFRALDGAKIKVKLLEAAGKEPVDYVIVIYGFEPTGDDQIFLVDVYGLDVSRKVFSAWSSSPPRIEDLNGDGTQELVVYEDIFSINRPDAPNWPRVFELSSSIEAMTLGKFRQLLVDLRMHSVAALDASKKTCRAFAPAPCPLESTITGLKTQITVVDVQLGKSGDVSGGHE